MKCEHEVPAWGSVAKSRRAVPCGHQLDFAGSKRALGRTKNVFICRLGHVTVIYVRGPG